MITQAELQYLRANPRFLVLELQRRGIEVTVLEWEHQVLEARIGDHVELLQDIDSSLMPYATSIVASNKGITKLLLQRAGISVPGGRRFEVCDRRNAGEYADSLGFPVVVKPALGVQGELVQLDLYDQMDVELALDTIYQERGPCEVIVEQQCPGREHRLFITRTGQYAVLRRDPAHIFGDGKQSIRNLALQESDRRMNPRRNCLCPVVMDQEAERFLRRNSRTPDSVPEPGEKVYLRGSSNVKLGGVPEDVTELVHPSFIELGLRVLQAIPGLPYAGIDVLATDVTQTAHSGNYAVLEVNSLPGIGMHHAPGKGMSRNVAGMIVDLMFPETCSAALSLAA